MKKLYYTIILIFWSFLQVNAQNKNISYYGEVLGSFTSSYGVPFWLRSNQYGNIPLDKISMSVIGSAHKDYSNAKTHLIDWGASV